MHFPLLPLISLLLPMALAHPSPTTPRDSPKKPTPVRPFTVAAFQSPYPPGSNNSLSGVVMRAQGGSFWLNALNPKPDTGCGGQNKRDDRNACPPGTETVAWVDIDGHAWLDSISPQQIYLDTQTGILSYLSPSTSPPLSFKPGAVVANFLHLGEGTQVAVPVPQAPGFYNVGPGTFQWIGIDFNPTWFACPRPGPGYQVMKDVGGLNDWSQCVSGLQLVALDYGGVSPAAGVYL